MAQADSFTASAYYPEAWVDLIKKSGARYAVITSKHHDGVALWETELSDLSIPRKTPAGRDVLTPYCKGAQGKRVESRARLYKCS